MAPELTDHIWAVMQNCWSDAPDDRPTIDQVLERLPITPSQSQLRPRGAIDSRNGALSDSEVTFLMDMVSEPFILIFPCDGKLMACSQLAGLQ